METRMLSATQCAALTVLLYDSYKEHKNLSRFSLSSKVLRQLARRPNLRENFIQDWTDEMLELGWVVATDGKRFIAVKQSTTAAWPKLSIKKLSVVLPDDPRQYLDEVYVNICNENSASLDADDDEQD